jgi:hypothetical protein
MTDSPTTPFSNQCDILGEFWLTYKNDEEFADFIDYNDVGLPLAYAISMNLVTSTTLAEKFINETWELFLSGLGVEDTGFDSLLDIMPE